MKRKLQWKSFDTFEAQEAFAKKLFDSLTPGQRLERLVAMIEVRLMLGIPPKAIDPQSFVLRKKQS